MLQNFDSKTLSPFKIYKLSSQNRKPHHEPENSLKSHFTNIVGIVFSNYI